MFWTEILGAILGKSFFFPFPLIPCFSFSSLNDDDNEYLGLSLNKLASDWFYVSFFVANVLLPAYVILKLPNSDSSYCLAITSLIPKKHNTPIPIMPAPIP